MQKQTLQSIAQSICILSGNAALASTLDPRALHVGVPKALNDKVGLGLGPGMLVHVTFPAMRDITADAVAFVPIRKVLCIQPARAWLLK
jgi:hypothetical protein